MTTGPESQEHIRPELTDLVAETHGKALARLQSLLKPHGLRAVRAHTIGIHLRGDGMSWPKGRVTYQAPELTVYDDAGWVVATVTIGLRAAHYLVSLPTMDVGCQIVRPDQPYAVVDMIRAARKASV